jgi:phenylpropionate dioxygenase-like ring-hydroxylating dioxygenase large terminal subunit
LEVKVIPNQWYAVLESNEVKLNKPVGVLRMGERLVFWRTEANEIVCMRDLCPHRGAALSKGKLVDGHLQCPFHGFEFDASGQCVLVPANGRSGPVPKAISAHTYPAREQNGFIWIWWGEWQQDLPVIHFLDEIDETFSYSTIRDHWQTHYSRAIENQLDVAHLPFIHYNTIGRGNRTVVDGPLTDCCLEGTSLYVWVFNRVDDGIPARGAREMSKPDRHPNLQFIFPNIWQNWISDDLRVVAAFVPIDDENTMMYLRFCQKFMTVPLIRSLVNGFGSLGNLYIERQDRWVVETQHPKRSGLRIGEHPVPADQPIILYRKQRETLLAGNQELQV